MVKLGASMQHTRPRAAGSRAVRLAAVFCMLMLMCGCTDDAIDASYADVEAVVADGAITRGWIPAWIPPDAFDIREVHDIDSNESALVFELPEGSRWTPPSPECERTTGRTFRGPTFDREWLPDVSDDFKLYGCGTTESPGSPPKVITLAISADGRRVVHWRHHLP